MFRIVKVERNRGGVYTLVVAHAHCIAAHHRVSTSHKYHITVHVSTTYIIIKNSYYYVLCTRGRKKRKKIIAQGVRQLLIARELRVRRVKSEFFNFTFVFVEQVGTGARVNKIECARRDVRCADINPSQFLHFSASRSTNQFFKSCTHTTLAVWLFFIQKTLRV